MEGYIKLHRKLLDWEWYDDINTKILFIHLLLKANHKDKKWRGITIYPGETLTGRISLSEELGLSQQKIRTSLNKLKSTNEITIKTTNKYSIIKLCNWEEYQQNNQQSTQQATSKQPTNNHKQEGKEGKEIYIGASRSEVIQELEKILEHWNSVWKEKRKKTKDLENVYLSVRKKYSKEDIQQAYIQYIEEKKDVEKQYRLDPYRFFKQKNGFITYL